jgi:triacylglycerol esterase/lipase EstA (alpha/beta hydrolase family)
LPDTQLRSRFIRSNLRDWTLAMLARAFRRVLLIELIIYIVLGWCLVRYAGWLWIEAAAAAIAFAVAMRAFGVAATFAIAGRHASPTPPEHRPGLLGWLRLYLAELGAYIVIYNLYQPFEPLLMGAETLQPLPPGRLPVLLVHGYVCNRGFMLPLRRYLGEHGVSAYSHNLEPVYSDIDGYADALAQRIEDICAATGADKLVILAHSMGGLAARACLRKHGARRVAKLITLGTPHHGTALARLGAGANGRQMVPGNAWLMRLNEAVPAVPTVCVFSHQDNIVSPQDSAVLEGAKIVGLSGMGHVSMPFSRHICEIALAEIQAVSR